MKRSLILATLPFLLSFQVLAASPDEDLTYRANFGSASDIMALVAQGAAVDSKNKQGWHAISLAASRTDEEALKVVQALTEAGVNVNVRDPNGDTPLMNAIINNNAAMARLLVEKGADVHAVNTQGRTVKYTAEWYGNAEIIKLVDDTILQEKNLVKQGKSRRRMYHILDEFIYYSCAYQYFSHNKQVDFYTKDQLPMIDKGIQKARDVMVNAQIELMYNFKMPSDDITKIATSVSDTVYGELGNMISNRNRRSQGVGTKDDLSNRCHRILKAWQAGFGQYEQQAELSEKP